MTEHKERVQAWMDEAGDEPTPFGKAVMDVTERRGIGSPEWLDEKLRPETADALRDHCDGVEDAARPLDLPLTVVHAIGLDPETAAGEDRADLDRIAMAWTFGDRL
ncbi:MAG: hypothetical protein H0U55_08225 [Rubrobacteraceae bacterium]|nr:hypothetical protein [Rubrobacteraceae bacterium]